MKITLSCWWSEDEHFTHEWQLDHIDGHKIEKYIDEQVELRRLRREKAQAEATEPKCRVTVEPGSALDTGPHARVFEYDGAFQCLGCHAQWGALPGKPAMPTICINADQASHL